MNKGQIINERSRTPYIIGAVFLMVISILMIIVSAVLYRNFSYEHNFYLTGEKVDGVVVDYTCYLGDSQIVVTLIIKYESEDGIVYTLRERFGQYRTIPVEIIEQEIGKARPMVIDGEGNCLTGAYDESYYKNAKIVCIIIIIVGSIFMVLNLYWLYKSIKIIVNKKKVIIPIIIILSFVIVASGVICAIIFWPPSLQEQLNQFKESLEMLNDTKLDENGNLAMRNIIRSIIINENDETVAEYKQTIKIFNDDEGRGTAYLSFQEEYPTLETSEFDIFDEYYLHNSVMFTRRDNNGEFSISSFTSNIETFFVVLFENMGSTKYDFSKENFKSLRQGISIISREGNMKKLAALINTGHGDGHGDGGIDRN